MLSIFTASLIYLVMVLLYVPVMFFCVFFLGNWWRGRRPNRGRLYTLGFKKKIAGPKSLFCLTYFVKDSNNSVDYIDW